MESSSTTEKDFDFLKALNEYYSSSIGETKAVLDSISIYKFRMERFDFDAYRSYAITE